MDRETMIAAITREVYRYLEEHREPEAKEGEYILLTDMRPDTKLAHMKQLFAAAKEKGSFAVCVPQWFVDPAAKELRGTDVKIATVVGLPGGTTSSLAKYAEIKQAVAAGADLVLIPANMQLCKRKDWAGVKKDLAESLTAAKGKAPAWAILEVKDLRDEVLLEAASACLEGGAEMILLSCVTGGIVEPGQIRALKSEGMSVGVYGGASGVGSQQKYGQAGASCLAVPYC